MGVWEQRFFWFLTVAIAVDALLVGAGFHYEDRKAGAGNGWFFAATLLSAFCVALILIAVLRWFLTWVFERTAIAAQRLSNVRGQSPARDKSKVGLEITGASWGVPGDHANYANVTENIRAHVKDDHVRFTVDAGSLKATDPKPNVAKTLWIKYRFDGKDYDEHWQDGQTVEIPPGRH